MQTQAAIVVHVGNDTDSLSLEEGWGVDPLNNIELLAFSHT